MPWIPITDDHLATVLTGGEIDAVRTAALQEGQGDPVPTTIETVVGEVRGYIAGCERNKLGPAGTLPTQLISVAMTVVRNRLINRFPELGLMSEARTNEYNTAMTALRDVAACRIKVEEPPADEIGPEKMPSGAGAKLVHRTRLRFTRDQTDRL